VSNVRYYNLLAGMGLEVVNIQVHHGNGFITYCDSRMDLSPSQYVDTSVSNLLQMWHADVLGWVHNFLQVNLLHRRLKVSSVVPRKREHGWRWELYEMRNLKCWRAFMDMALYKFKFPLVVLIQQEMAYNSHGKQAWAMELIKMRKWLKPSGPMNRMWRRSRNRWSMNNLSMKLMIMKTRLVVKWLLIGRIGWDDCWWDGVGWRGGRDASFFFKWNYHPEKWNNFSLHGLTVNDGHDSNWVYDQVEITRGQMFHDKVHLQYVVKSGLSLRRNYSRW
jgi:hypothetical protein